MTDDEVIARAVGGNWGNSLSVPQLSGTRSWNGQKKIKNKSLEADLPFQLSMEAERA